MPRRVMDTDSQDHDRWIISYADFITLLFAFFVVMYSISSVHEDKYRVLTETLENLFEPEQVESALNPGQSEDTKSEVTKLEPDLTTPQPGDDQTVNDPFGLHSAEPNKPKMAAIKDSLSQALRSQVADGDITLSGSPEWVAIDINSNFLFESGAATPTNSAERVVSDLAAMLVSFDYPIHVEGFTDDIPISTPQFPSNWELSAARSAAIVRLLAFNGVAPSRLAAVGYGEHQPIASNMTEQGRSKNRRVRLVISKGNGLANTNNTGVDIDDSRSDEVFPFFWDQAQQPGPGIMPDLDSPPAENPNLVPESIEEMSERGIKTVPLQNGGVLFTNE